LAALRAGDALGVPVVGFCHTDLGKLAALHIGEWAEKPVQKRWAAVYRQFDQAVAPSRFIAGRLIEAGVHNAIGLPLGVDTELFHPGRGDREALRRRLGVSPDEKLLVFAGRPAREKRLDILVGAVERLGAPYKLLFVGAGGGAPASDRTISIDYVREPVELARILASCDAFVHANDNEPFGLIVLEAMACGLPVVGVAAGGVAESVDGSGNSPRARRRRSSPRRLRLCSRAISRLLEPQRAGAPLSVMAGTPFSGSSVSSMAV
jgi:alpha-1,6-mannosyltransferase